MGLTKFENYSRITTDNIRSVPVTPPVDRGPEPALLRFDPFELDLRTGELRRQGQLVKLQQQPFKVLSLLARRSGDLVTREEIKREIWSEETFVDFDQGLNFCIKQVRIALRDQADTPRYIETLPRRGYRFLAPVEALDGSGRRAAVAAETASSPVEPPRRSRLSLWVSVTALALLAVLGWTFVNRSRSQAASNALAPAPPKRLMLVVLPFQNLSADPAQEYFSDGLTDEMITQLGRLDPEHLGVIARGSSMQYKDRAVDVATVGRELGIDYVVEGTVRRGGDRVRITAKLVQSKDRTQVWSEQYDRDLKDILSLQGDVARAVARAVQITLSPSAENRLAQWHPVDPEAYQLYLQGRFFWNRRDREGLTRAIDYFSRAIERSPNEALAYVGIADAYIVLTDQGSVAATESMPKAKDAATKALSLDPELAEAHASLAMIRASFDWDWAAAEAGFRRASEINPNYATTHHWYSHLLRALRRFDEALDEIRRAQSLDPLSLIINSNVGSALFYAGRYAEAEAQYKRVLEMNARFAPTYWSLGRLKLHTGDVNDAIAFHEKAVEVSDRDPAYLCSLGHAYGIAGRREQAQRLLREVEAMGKRRYVAPMDLALIHLGLGDRTKTLDLVESAVNDHFSGVRQLRIEERFLSLHGDPRFEELCRRVGI